MPSTTRASRSPLPLRSSRPRGGWSRRASQRSTRWTPPAATHGRTRSGFVTPTGRHGRSSRLMRTPKRPGTVAWPSRRPRRAGAARLGARVLPRARRTPAAYERGRSRAGSARPADALARTSILDVTETLHRHGSHAHAHPAGGSHRHLLRPLRSRAVGGSEHHHHARGHSHTHGLVDDSIKRSRAGLRASPWRCSCSRSPPASRRSSSPLRAASLCSPI